MIKGTKVTLIVREETEERDAFNHPISKETRVEIDDVLIAPVSSADILNNTSLDGHKAVYTLAIPKTDNHSWTNAIVEFYGQKWHVIGFPIEGIQENIPLRWNKKVTVEAYE